MNKELLISIKPEHLANILNGKKTLELRKTVPKDYKGPVNIYCTKGGKGLFKDNDYFLFNNGNSSISLNGKVVARFWFDEYDVSSLQAISVSGEALVIYSSDYKIKNSKYELHHFTSPNEYGLYEKSCVTVDEYIEYSKNGENIIYLWHIKNLEIFDKPKELSEFGVERPPQSYQFVYVKE